MERRRTDWVSFGTCVALVILVCMPLAGSPERAGGVLQQGYDYIAHEFGVFYLLASVGTIVFLVWLAIGRHGSVRLGAQEEAPEFPTISWVAMLFCAGVGAGLLSWCMTEWSYYYEAPPFGVAPRSEEAAEWASTYGMFHWGITAWAFYCLPTIAIAFPYYVKKLDVLRFSIGCHAFLKNREHGPTARLIDLLFMIALLGGAASSLGFSTPMIASALGWLLHTEADFSLEVTVVLLCVSLFAVSVWAGLQKGIRRLSDINLWLAFGLLAFILFAGPSSFLLKTSLNSLGVMADNFLRMSFYTDPFSGSGFVEDWTVFYWAWWIAFAPYVGLFVTRISRGRTIRQVVLGMLAWGSLGSWVFYMIMGNYALFLELSGALEFTRIVRESGGGAAIVAALETLPMAPLVMTLFAVIAIVFSATTYDSASYALASSATLHLPAGDNPARWHRLFWAFALGALPVTLMFIDGGIKVMQVVLLVVSAPILLVGVVMSVSLVRSLRDREAAHELD